jgi:hypothetical protein
MWQGYDDDHDYDGLLKGQNKLAGTKYLLSNNNIKWNENMH